MALSSPRALRLSPQGSQQRSPVSVHRVPANVTFGRAQAASVQLKAAVLEQLSAPSATATALEAWLQDSLHAAQHAACSTLSPTALSYSTASNAKPASSPAKQDQLAKTQPQYMTLTEGWAAKGIYEGLHQQPLQQQTPQSCAWLTGLAQSDAPHSPAAAACSPGSGLLDAQSRWEEQHANIMPAQIPAPPSCPMQQSSTRCADQSRLPSYLPQLRPPDALSSWLGGSSHTTPQAMHLGRTSSSSPHVQLHAQHAQHAQQARVGDHMAGSIALPSVRVPARTSDSPRYQRYTHSSSCSSSSAVVIGSPKFYGTPPSHLAAAAAGLSAAHHSRPWHDPSDGQVLATATKIAASAGISKQREKGAQAGSGKADSSHPVLDLALAYSPIGPGPILASNAGSASTVNPKGQLPGVITMRPQRWANPITSRGLASGAAQMPNTDISHTAGSVLKGMPLIRTVRSTFVVAAADATAAMAGAKATAAAGDGAERTCEAVVRGKGEMGHAPALTHTNSNRMPRYAEAGSPGSRLPLLLQNKGGSAAKAMPALRARAAPNAGGTGATGSTSAKGKVATGARQLAAADSARTPSGSGVGSQPPSATQVSGGGGGGGRAAPTVNNAAGVPQTLPKSQPGSSGRMWGVGQTGTAAAHQHLATGGNKASGVSLPAPRVLSGGGNQTPAAGGTSATHTPTHLRSGGGPSYACLPASSASRVTGTGCAPRQPASVGSYGRTGVLAVGGSVAPMVRPLGSSSGGATSASKKVFGGGSAAARVKPPGPLPASTPPWRQNSEGGSGRAAAGGPAKPAPAATASRPSSGSGGATATTLGRSCNQAEPAVPDCCQKSRADRVAMGVQHAQTSAVSVHGRTSGPAMGAATGNGPTAEQKVACAGIKPSEPHGILPTSAQRAELRAEGSDEHRPCGCISDGSNTSNDSNGSKTSSGALLQIVTAPLSMPSSAASSQGGAQVSQAGQAEARGTVCALPVQHDGAPNKAAQSPWVCVELAAMPEQVTERHTVGELALQRAATARVGQATTAQASLAAAAAKAEPQVARLGVRQSIANMEAAIVRRGSMSQSTSQRTAGPGDASATVDVYVKGKTAAQPVMGLRVSSVVARLEQLARGAPESSDLGRGPGMPRRTVSAAEPDRHAVALADTASTGVALEVQRKRAVFARGAVGAAGPRRGGGVPLAQVESAVESTAESRRVTADDAEADATVPYGVPACAVAAAAVAYGRPESVGTAVRRMSNEPVTRQMSLSAARNHALGCGPTSATRLPLPVLDEADGLVQVARSRGGAALSMAVVDRTNTQKGTTCMVSKTAAGQVEATAALVPAAGVESAKGMPAAKLVMPGTEPEATADQLIAAAKPTATLAQKRTLASMAAGQAALSSTTVAAVCVGVKVVAGTPVQAAPARAQALAPQAPKLPEAVVANGRRAMGPQVLFKPSAAPPVRRPRATTGTAPLTSTLQTSKLPALKPAQVVARLLQPQAVAAVAKAIATHTPITAAQCAAALQPPTVIAVGSGAAPALKDQPTPGSSAVHATHSLIEAAPAVAPATSLATAQVAHAAISSAADQPLLAHRLREVASAPEPVAVSVLPVRAPTEGLIGSEHAVQMHSTDPEPGHEGASPLPHPAASAGRRQQQQPQDVLLPSACSSRLAGRLVAPSAPVPTPRLVRHGLRVPSEAAAAAAAPLPRPVRPVPRADTAVTRPPSVTSVAAQPSRLPRHTSTATPEAPTRQHPSAATATLKPPGVAPARSPFAATTSTSKPAVRVALPVRPPLQPPRASVSPLPQHGSQQQQQLAAAAEALGPNFALKAGNVVITRDADGRRQQLGAGGFAAVFEGVLHEAEVVAVKVLKKSNPTLKEVQGFISEAVLWSRLQHPSILAFRGACLTPGPGQPLLLASELMAGGDLYSALRANPEKFSWHALGHSVALSVAQALSYLHGRNPSVVHRDVKSPNVLLSLEGKAVLGDLGASVEAPQPHARPRRDAEGGGVRGDTTDGGGAEESAGPRRRSAGGVAPAILPQGGGGTKYSGMQGSIAARGGGAQVQGGASRPQQQQRSVTADVVAVACIAPAAAPAAAPAIMTPLWSAPEVVNKERSGAPADVWSLGLIIWELVSRQDIALHLPLGVTSQVAPGAKSALRMPPGMPEVAARVFEACTQLDPRSRPSAAQVVEMLAGA